MRGLLRGLSPRRRVVIVAMVTSVLVLTGLLVAVRHRKADVVVGVPSHKETTQPWDGLTETVDAAIGGEAVEAIADQRGGHSGSGDADEADNGPGGANPEPPPRPGLKSPNGRPFRSPIPFNGDIPIPKDLVWVLLVGSDARPGQDLLRSRADSIHLVAANPRSGQATVLGLPRDSWVPIPGHGTSKINAAMAWGGPDLLADTVHQLTGLPVQFWVVTGFTGMAAMVDEVGGVDVYVERRMADSYSGAFFEPGWHHMNGGEALAYCRDRHDTASGDFTRSWHQGQMMLSALAKLRAEVGDIPGLKAWLDIGLRHVSVRAPYDTLFSLAGLARHIDVSQVRNIVAPGRSGRAGTQSVVYLDGPAFAAILDDLRPDAVIGPAGPTTSTSTAPPSTTTTTTAPTTTAASSSTSTTKNGGQR